MASTEGNGDQQPNAAALPNGEIWFPTTRGVVIVNPDNLHDNQTPPGVVIEEVRVEGSPRTYLAPRGFASRRFPTSVSPNAAMVVMRPSPCARRATGTPLPRRPRSSRWW